MTVYAPSSEKIYQPSDLNQGYRPILDEAKDGGHPRIRDKDGVSLVIVLERDAQAQEWVADASASYLILFDAYHDHRDSLSVVDFGSWPWLKHFDSDGVGDFLEELRPLLVAANKDHSCAPDAFETVRAWRVSADALSDPVRRSILLGDHADDDFVEVGSPPEADDS